jgi:hypothetical protein
MAKRKYRPKKKTVIASKYTLIKKREATVILVGRDRCPLKGGQDPLQWRYCHQRIDGGCKYFYATEGYGVVCKHPGGRKVLADALRQDHPKKKAENLGLTKPSEELTETQKAMQQALFNF